MCSSFNHISLHVAIYTDPFKQLIVKIILRQSLCKFILILQHTWLVVLSDPNIKPKSLQILSFKSLRFFSQSTSGNISVEYADICESTFIQKRIWEMKFFFLIQLASISFIKVWGNSTQVDTHLCPFTIKSLLLNGSLISSSAQIF